MKTPFLDKDEAGSGGIPTRAEVRLEDTWDLTILYPEPGDWQNAFEKLQRDYPQIAQWKGRVGSSVATLREVLEFEKQLGLNIERLAHYASLQTSGDSSDNANLAREGQLENLFTLIGESQSFVEPEIMAIDAAVFETFLQDPLLADWITPLRKRRRFLPHTLTTAEERLLALGGSAVSGHGETFSQLTNVDMKFGVIVDEKGIERELSQSSYSSFMVKRDPELRKRAWHQFYGEFEAHKFTVASTLANSIKGDVFKARARNFPSARERALFSDDVPVSVYDRLISSVRSNLAPLFRYLELRRSVLGLKEVHAYDTNVPIVPNIETDVPWDRACDQVLAALAPLGEEYVQTLGEGLRGRWCDRYENKGKRSGAFSSSSYGNPPFILMNYKRDVFTDVYTLAHEAGHSMHTWYAQKTQPFQTYDYPIFLAEVASTFNEELLTHYLLENTEDKAMRAYLINRQIDDIRGTVIRQTMFAEFEKIAHAKEETGEPLTLDTFRGIYRELLEAYFGPGFTIDSELELECLRIPHFYSAFYVYKYATGLSAAVALATQVRETGDATRYLAFLQSGGSEFPIPTLQRAGVDMSSPAPVEATLQLLARRVGELEALLA